MAIPNKNFQRRNSAGRFSKRGQYYVYKNTLARAADSAPFAKQAAKRKELSKRGRRRISKTVSGAGVGGTALAPKLTRPAPAGSGKMRWPEFKAWLERALFGNIDPAVIFKIGFSWKKFQRVIIYRLIPDEARAGIMEIYDKVALTLATWMYELYPNNPKPGQFAHKSENYMKRTAIGSALAGTRDTDFWIFRGKVYRAVERGIQRYTPGFSKRQLHGVWLWIIRN